MDSTPYAEAASLVELLNSQEDSVFRLVDGSLEPSSSQFPLFGSQAVSSPFSDASSFGVEKGTEHDDRMKRPPGVKAAKAAARGKKKQMAEGKEVSDFQTMWELKKEDLVRKERVVKLRLLDKLYGKKEPLDDEEREMKKKLMLEL
ncbi:glutathione S-transferase T3-like [Raphanus sativus]|nr:glutathione S-transferase T3-like [Raphanus sativus]